MSLKLSCFLILFVLNTVHSSYDEYFKKSIFRVLKNQNGQFIAKINQVNAILKDENITIFDSYNFDNGVGRVYNFRVTRDNKKSLPIKTTYIRKTKEFYRIYLKLKNSCYSDFIDKLTVKSELQKWAPINVFNNNFEYSILGPSVLLEVLLEQYSRNSKNVDCNNKSSNIKKCSIKFGKKTMIEYYFIENDNYTMIPKLIIILNLNKKKWQIADKFVYENFRFLFNKKPKYNHNLDIGYGCGRLNAKSYPQIQTPFFDTKIKLDYQVKFNYVEVKHNDKLVYVEDKYNFRNKSTKTYWNSVYIDLKKQINIIDTVNEHTDSPITSFFDLKKLNILYNYDSNSDKCIAYDLPRYRLINWFYLNDQMIFNPQLFTAYNNYYSYIGEFEVDNVTSLVFEKKFKIDRSLKESGEKKFPKNSTLTNKNRVHPDSVLATHYYAKDRNYWPNNKENFSVPFKIEFHLYDQAIPYLKIANLTVHIKSFDPNPKFEPKFDISKCGKFGSSDQRTTNNVNETVQTITPANNPSSTSMTTPLTTSSNTDSSNNKGSGTESPKLSEEDRKGNCSMTIRD